MNEKDINAIFEILQKENPNPITELHFNSPFELLIAVLLSAQATDVSVNRATEKLFKVANTPESMVALGEDKLREIIKTIGLFNTKARHVIQTSNILIEKYNGHVPKDREALEALPGVGRKTANVILNTAFGLPTIAVDTHVFRVSRRLGLSKGKTPLEVERDLVRVIPKAYLKDAHHWLVLHGRYICKAKKPLCLECPVAKFCAFYTHSSSP